ncbi:MAG: hypothetical protein ACXVUX_07385 [Solirubrobacteraceae bacterium]
MPTTFLPSAPRARAIAGAAVLALCAALLTCSAAAHAALLRAPGNDDRDAATNLPSLPVTVSGTTIGATLESTEPDTTCPTSISASVWYAVTVGATPPSRIGIKLQANGSLDATVDVYVRQRSQSNPVDCRRTDDSGKAALAFTPIPGTTYLIRIGQRLNSDPGTFTLRVFPLPPPPSPPGRHLGPRGADGLLDGTLATRAAYSMRLSAGATYKVNLVKPNQGCMQLEIFPPGTSSFSAASAAGLSCGGYRLFTPAVSGVWSFLILADESNPGSQAYGLHVRPATFKEMAPGIFLPNLSHYTGFLRGNVIDDVRLFRFDVTSHSDLTLFLQAASDAPFDLKLLDDRGRYLQCNCGSTGEETIRRQIQPGRYFAVVQAESFGWGPFTLYRQTRLITHIHTTMDGVGYEQVAPNQAVRIDARITPAVDGPVTIEVESFDPVEHWQFHRLYSVRAVNGLAEVPFVAPHVGRWRASAVFTGTKTASPATSGTAQILVVGPLQQ